MSSTLATSGERLPAAIEQRLRDVAGPGGLITDPSALLVYEADGLMAHRVQPRAVVAPRGTAEVADHLCCFLQHAFGSRGKGDLRALRGAL